MENINEFYDMWNELKEDELLTDSAEIAYMGHHTGCVEFQCIHERESY